MNVVLAPDSFKGSVSAYEAAKAMSEGVLKAIPKATCEIMPMADGGDGTLEVLRHSLNCIDIACKAHNPMGEETQTNLLFINSEKAVWLETAQACGIALIPENKLDPFSNTSYGVGEMLECALRQPCDDIIISLGGSGTNDGGIGMLKALGAVFYDLNNKVMKPFEINLEKVRSVDLTAATAKLKGKKIRVLCDVDNPLLGERGASYVFGPQKGAYKTDIINLDKGMAQYAAVLEKATGKSAQNIPGAGAAGGLGFALYLISNAEFCSGADFMMCLLKLEEKIKNCDIVFTGEGSFDAQSLGGKVPFSVAQKAKAHGKPCVVLAGSYSNSESSHIYDNGISAIFSIQKGPLKLRQAMKDTLANIRVTSENIARVLNPNKER